MKYTLSALLGLSTLSATAQNITFSFLTDTWVSPTQGTTVGFSSGTGQDSSASTSGSTSKGGLTLNFGVSYFGGADSGENFPGEPVGTSLTNATGNLNPNGFLMTTSNNDSPGFVDGISGSLDNSTISKYQRWYFEFSAPVILDEFLMQDIDNTTDGFRDILGVEAYSPIGYSSAFTNGFNPALMPVAGSGMDPQFQLFGNPSFLTQGSAAIGSESLGFVAPTSNTNNPSSTANVRAGIDFGSSTTIKAFSIYAISNANNVHRMALNQSSFSVAVPEPSPAALGLIAACFSIARRRRR